MQVLRIKDSQDVVSEFSLRLQEGEQLSFGRSDACDISLPGEGTLSRTHCHIRRERGKILIRDNASVNGILCNGVSVLEAEMRTGLEFVLGRCHVVVEEYPDDVSPPVPEQEPIPLSSVRSDTPNEPSPVSASSIPLLEPLPVSAVAASAALPVRPPAAAPANAGVKKRRLVAKRVSPRRVVVAESKRPALRKRKKFSTRSIKTAAQKNPSHKRNRRPTVAKEKWVESGCVPTSHSGAELGLPVSFGIQLAALVPQYPLRAEDCMSLTVMADEKCYISVVQYDAEGKPSLIIPGSVHENSVVFPRILTRFPQPSGADYELVVEPPFGPVRLVLLACTEPCDWRKAYKEALTVYGPTPAPGRMEAAMKAAFPVQGEPPVWSSATLVLHTSA